MLKRKLAKYKFSGFTLIELLIVLTIIAILASLIVIAIGQARTKAQDRAIEANLVQVRQIAAAIYTESNSFIAPGNELCDQENTLNDGNFGYQKGLKTIEDEVEKRNGGTPVNCSATSDSYCIQTLLASGENFCLDYTGKAARGVCTVDNQCQ
jgi:prepilin-type N-terminal cleavage/methylation domain-containing protein